MRVTAPDSSFEWKTVAADGTITQNEFKVSDIKSLKFTVSPASDEVARIRGLVAQLASDDYRERHAAERTLLDEGKPFEKVIEQAQDHKEPEVRYRVDRILSHLKKKKQDNVTRFSIDFDILELKDGRTLEGDIGDWALKGTWNDIEVALDRSNCHLVMDQLPFRTWSETDAETTTVKSRSIFDEFEIFNQQQLEDEKIIVGEIKEGYELASFDKGARGEKMVSDRDFDVGNLFIHRGCLLSCETHNGIVVISGYKFKKSRSRQRSIGNFYVEPQKKKKTSYQGVMRIDFCIPGNGQVPATVNLAGVFTEIVIPEHTMMEAYNAAGHVIGLTYSARDKTSFLAVRSHEPIAYLKVSANHHLNVEKLNKDFAIDDLSYTPPVAAPELNFTDLAGEGATQIVVVTRDNQRLLAKSIQFNAAEAKLDVESVTEGIADFSVPLDQVVWISMPQSRTINPPADDGVYVMLTDGSVLHCRFEQSLVSTLNPELEIETDSIIGIWNSNAVCRYPQHDDFEHGSVVAVRPLNRIAFQGGEFDWNNGRFDYQLEDARNIKQAMLSDETPTLTEVALIAHLGIPENEPDPGNIFFDESDISVWKSEPPVRAPGTGLLRTNDGQQFVLGGESGFELGDLDGDKLSVSRGLTSVTFALSDIHTLNLPK